MPNFLLEHHHEPVECAAVFAAFKGHDTPLRHRGACSSCASGGHQIWWRVEAESAPAALALLPFYVAARTRVVDVAEVYIP
jgi:hypothetical protein